MSSASSSSVSSFKFTLRRLLGPGAAFWACAEGPVEGLTAGAGSALLELAVLEALDLRVASIGITLPCRSGPGVKPRVVFPFCCAWESAASTSSRAPLALLPFDFSRQLHKGPLALVKKVKNIKW